MPPRERVSSQLSGVTVPDSASQKASFQKWRLNKNPQSFLKHHLVAQPKSPTLIASQPDSDADSISEEGDEEQLDKVPSLQRNAKSITTMHVPFVRKKTINEKKKALFDAIKMQNKEHVVDAGLLAINDNTDDRFDEQGRIIRWKRVIEPDEEQAERRNRCSNRRQERQVNDLQADAFLEGFNEELYERLENRRRAISNWKRLKIVIVVLRMCNGKMNEMEQEENEKEEKEEQETSFKFDLYMSRFIMLPNNKYVIFWNVFMGVIYLSSIVFDTTMFAFKFQPLAHKGHATWNSIFSALMLLDVIVNFFTAIPRASQNQEDSEEEDEDIPEPAVKPTAKVENGGGHEASDDEVVLSKKQLQQAKMNQRAALLAKKKEEKKIRRRQRELERRNTKLYHPIYEKRFTMIFKKYVGQYGIGFFMFDLLACMPCLMYEASH